MKSATTVLVVDDEAMMRTLVEKILTREGYRVLLAGDGVEALEMLRTERVDIILSDMKMPRMDGFTLLKAVRAESPKTTFVIMTAFGDTYSVKDALLLGADEYLTKPFKSSEVSLVIERAYWRLQASKQAAEVESR